MYARLKGIDTRHEAVTSTDQSSTSKVDWLVHWADLRVDNSYLGEERTVCLLNLMVAITNIEIAISRRIWVLRPVKVCRKSGGIRKQQRTLSSLEIETNKRYIVDGMHRNTTRWF